MPSWLEIWRRPLDLQPRFGSRVTFRLLTSIARSRVVTLRGLDRIAPEADPFILAINHNSRLEAISLPGLLFFHRRGRVIHFLADWPMMLVPLVATVYRHGQIIPVGVKRARIRFFDVFRSRLVGPVPTFERCRETLELGASLGIFLEGTMNRDPSRLLRGQLGAARLAVETGVSIVPAGIRYSDQSPDQPISDFGRWSLEIGEPILPRPRPTGNLRRSVVSLHHEVMTAISELSGKSWNPNTRRRRHVPESRDSLPNPRR